MKNLKSVILCYVFGGVLFLIGVFSLISAKNNNFEYSFEPGAFAGGVVLLFIAVILHISGKKAEQEAAAAEAIRAKEAEARRAKEKAEREERIRKQIESEAAELEALENEDNIERVYRLTHCVSPSAQENIFYCYEGSRVYFSGDDEHDDVVWIVNDSGDRLGRLPKDAAAQYLEKGALGAFIKSLEDEDQNTIPFVRVFWRRA